MNSTQVCTLNHLQLVPFLIAILCHQLVGCSTELLCLIRHPFGAVFQTIQFIAALEHQHVCSTNLAAG